MLKGHVGCGVALQSLQGFGKGQLYSAPPSVRPSGGKESSDDLLTLPLPLAARGGHAVLLGLCQTVYAGELEGISMGLDDLLRAGPLLPSPPLEAHFFVDNQAGVGHSCLPQPSPGQTQRLRIRQQLEQVRTSPSLPPPSLFTGSQGVATSLSCATTGLHTPVCCTPQHFGWARPPTSRLHTQLPHFIPPQLSCNTT